MKPRQSAISGGIGVSTPCGAAPTRGITMFVHSWLERRMCRRICDPGIGPYRPRLPLTPRTPANQRSASGVGASAPCRQVSTRGISVSSPVCLVYRCMEGILIPRWDPILTGCGWLYEPPPDNDQRWGWGFHTVRDGIDRRDNQFRPRFVWFVYVLND